MDEQTEARRGRRWSGWDVALGVLVVVGLGLAVFSLAQPEAAKPEYWRALIEGPAVEDEVVAREMGPAPTLRKGPKTVYKGNLVSSWIATGAGDATYNGTYAESGTFNGQPSYTNGTRWLFLYGAGMWVLAPSTSSVSAYEGSSATLPANPWATGMEGGTPPAPTLAEDVAFPGDFPWPWWDDDAPSFGANTSIAPCLATLGGDDYLVLPSNDPTGGVYGFELFDLTAKTWSHVAAAGALFPSGGYDAGQTAACYDVGDGTHIDVCSGVWDDEGTPTFTWKRYSVTPGGSPTLISTQDVTLDTQDITPFVEVSAGNFRFILVDTDHLHICSYAAGAASYTASAPIALPALAGAYADVPTGDAGAGPLDQVLFVYDGTTYWMRHARAGSTDRIFVYTVGASSVTPLDDVLGVAFPDTPLDGWRQTWGDDPIRLCALGDLGMPVNTSTGVTCEKWVPGSNAIPHFVFADYPAQQRWYVRVGDVLWVVGWFDDAYEHQPFALDTSPIPTILEDLTGIGRGVGTATLQSMTPKDLEAEGTARGVGTADLRAATNLTATGIGRGVGMVNLQAVNETMAEGPGGRADLILTPGVWPGAARRVAVPGWFDRSSNRRYGGDIGNRRPPWWAPINEANETAEFVGYWTWFVESNEVDNPYPGAPLVRNALDPYYDWAYLSWAGEPTYEWTSEGVAITYREPGPWLYISPYVWDLLGIGADTDVTMLLDFTVPDVEALIPAWVLLGEALSGALHLSVLGQRLSGPETDSIRYDYWLYSESGGSGMRHNWVSFGAERLRHRMVLSLDRDGATNLYDDGERVGIVGDADFAIEVVDLTAAGRSGTYYPTGTLNGRPRYAFPKASPFLTSNESCIGYLLDEATGTYKWGIYDPVAGTVSELSETATRPWLASWSDITVSQGAACADGWPAAGALWSGVAFSEWCVPGQQGGDWPFYFWGGAIVLHEFGILSGYAATAEDVAENPALATPYGMRGALTPVTDRV